MGTTLLTETMVKADGGIMRYFKPKKEINVKVAKGILGKQEELKNLKCF